MELQDFAVFFEMKILKRFLLPVVACCFAADALAVTESLVKVAGYEVTGTEFNYYYRKATAAAGRLSARDYLPHFVNFKLKVADARAQGWDTLPDYRMLCATLQGELMKSMLLDTARVEKWAREVYDRSCRRLSRPGWVKLEELSVPLKQEAGHAQVEAALRMLEGCYKAAAGGKALAQCMPAASKMACVTKAAGWMPLSALTDEFVAALERVGKGQCTPPFASPLGVHLVRVVDRVPVRSYEETRPYILSVLEQRQDCISAVLDKDAFEAWSKRQPDFVSELQWKMKEVQEGVLAARWDALHAVQVSEPTEEELERFFKAHKERYRWDLPHFRGGVIWCKSKKAASKIKKLLKKRDVSQWKTVLDVMQKEDGIYECRFESGVFQIGRHAAVDKLVFKCGELPVDKELPYVFVLGKKLKKGPELYTDVREEVTADVRNEQENFYLKELRQKYEVEYSAEILNSVNFAGYNEY